MSWQKVATINPGADKDDVAVGGGVPSVTCWSPSGKWIAVANDRTVSLYGVETLANPPGGAGLTSETTEAQHSWKVEEPILGLFWAHVGRPHPTAWRPLEDEMEDEISWSYQSKFVDTTKIFLPPSSYLHPPEDDDHHRDQEQTTATALPESKTPLSVLCLCTAKTLEFYLHGRYRLMSLHRSVDAAAPCRVEVSNDLSYFLVQSGVSLLSLYHLPFFKRDRYPLQIVASLQASISAHLDALNESILECTTSWRSSLKPLDTKLQPLLRLLQNYGVDDQTLGAVLKQYILVGHTSESSSIANAMDQFFTSVQMNDQLLQRMERSLHGALANVEILARKGLLSPMQALCYEVQELAGHVQYHHNASELVAPLRDLLQGSHHLWISVHTILYSIVQGRHHVRDFCSWLRSTGSEIKARGTASNSVQRENAKKRRVPQVVIERLLGCLNTATLDNAIGTSLSEHLLSITTSRMLQETTEFVPLRKAKALDGRPESPASVMGLIRSTPTIPHAVKLTEDSFHKVLVNPLSNIPKSIVPKDLRIPLEASCSSKSSSSSSRIALHMRIGCDIVTSVDPWEAEGAVADENESERTYFAPKALDGDVPMENASTACCCRQWAVVAAAGDNTVQLFAFPLGWRDPDDDDIDVGIFDDDDDEKEEGCNIPFYLTAKLILPPGRIRDVGFYGDDGKSTLSSGNDSGTGQERRQKLGLLFQVPDDDDDNDGDDSSSSSPTRLELWLASYDSLRWQKLPFSANLVPPGQVASFATSSLKPQRDGEEDGEEEGTWAQTRTICTMEIPEADVQLQLCGSRGVGAVAVGGEGTTTIELYDLEEDDDDDEEPNDDDDDDNGEELIQDEEF